MKLALFTATPLAYGGGYENFLVGLHAHARRRGIDAMVVEAPSRFLRTASRAAGSSNAFAKLSPESGTPSWRAALCGADIVYGKAEVVDLAILHAIGVQRKRIVVGMHTPIRYPRKYQSLMRRFAYSQAALRILLSGVGVHFLTSSQCDDIPRIESRSAVIPNGVAVQHMPQTGGPRNPPYTLLFVGRGTKQKGVEHLLHFAMSTHVGRIHICGDGPEIDLLRRKVSDARAPFLFHGWCAQEKVEELMLASDFLLVPSNWEALPLTVLTALQLGLPAVTSTIPVFERLASEIPGITTTTFDPISIDKSLVLAGTGTKKREEIAHMARERFDARKQYDALIDFLTSAF